MKALILSGGSGTRLRPLTYTHAKQLIPLANKPTLFYIVEKIARCGIKDIGVIVGTTHEEVKNLLGTGERWGIRISYIKQSAPLGLAHAVKIAHDFLGDSDFLMALGDNAFSMELDRFIQNHYHSSGNTSILLHRVKNPSQYGVAVVEGDRIIRLVEKPQQAESDLIITGIYIFDSLIFRAIDKTAPSARGELEITDAIQKQIEMGDRVTFDHLTGWWKDTGKVQDILEANRLILHDLEPDLKSQPDDASSCSGPLVIGKNVTVQRSRLIGPIAIADGAVITDSYIGPYSAIGENVTIHNCELENSIILDGAQLCNIDKRINGSLIGKDALIKQADERPLSNYFLIGDNSQIYL